MRLSRLYVLLSIGALWVMFAGTSARASYNPRISVTLGYGGQPTLGNTFTVLCTLRSEIDTTVVSQATVRLRGGLRVSSTGDTTYSYTDSLSYGTEAVYSETVVADSSGAYAIEVEFLAPPTGVPNERASDVLLLYICEDPEEVGKIDPLSAVASIEGGVNQVNTIEAGIVQMDYPYEFNPIPGYAPDSVLSSWDDTSESSSGTMTVRGQVRYVDAEGNWAPLVYATILAQDQDDGVTACGPFDWDGPKDEFLGLTTTDANGEYSITFESGECGGGIVDVYITVRLVNTAVGVHHGGSELGPYYDVGALREYRLGTYWNYGHSVLNVGRLDIRNYRELRDAWTFQHLSRAYDRLTDEVDDYGANPPTVVAEVYQPGPGETSRYKSYADVILIALMDAPLDYVVMHEYGHFITDWLSAYSSGQCDGPHFWEQVNNEQCAWSEGVANFFGAVLSERTIGASVKRCVKTHQATSFRTSSLTSFPSANCASA